MIRSAFLLFLLISAPLLRAQEQPLVIGTREAPPFALKGSDGNWEGLSIDLWRTIADELSLEYEFREIELNEMTRAVANGEIDAAVAALTITAAREKQLDFSHPFYTAGLGIATPAAQGEINWFAAARSLVSPAFLQVILALGLVLLAAGLGIWFFERKRNPDQFGGSAAEGLGSGFWWSAVTMTTVGYGDKAPVTLGGRIVGLIWMFVSVIIISSFTAAITSSLTVSSLEPSIRGAEDLPGKTVAVLEGSTSEKYLQGIGVQTSPFPSIRQAIEAVRNKTVDAAVHDRPILKYYANEVANVDVLVPTFRRQDYGIALPFDSELRNPVNVILLEQIRSPWWEQRHRRYLGE